MLKTWELGILTLLNRLKKSLKVKVEEVNISNKHINKYKHHLFTLHAVINVFSTFSDLGIGPPILLMFDVINLFLTLLDSSTNIT